jgi:peptidoglycan/LPS O-acetylase OafA/YrhL
MFGLSKSRNFGLDILRATAILLVFLEHLDWGYLNTIKPFSIFGILGVELFFVLSGFLIGRIVFKLNLKTSRPSFRKFYLNRWFRTLPLYYCAFIAFQLIDAFHYQKLNIHWSYLIFLQNWFPDPHGFFAVSWSLAIEEWFYLILPWIIYGLLNNRITKNHLFVSLITLVGVIIFIRTIYVFLYNPTFDPDIRKSVLFHFDPLLIGVILAMIQKEKPQLFASFRNSKFIALSVFSILIFTGYFIYLNSYSAVDTSFLIRIFGLTWVSLGMAIAIAFFEQNLFIKNRLIQNKKIFVSLTLISLLSYSIYIWHYEINKIIFFGTHVLFKTNFPQAILSIILTAVVAYISYKWIETPFLNLRKKING